MWYQVEYMDIYKTMFAGVPEMVDRGDGKDGSINWPVVCPPNCQPFCQGFSRRQSLTSIPITVLLFIFYKQQTLGNASRAHD